MNDASKWKELLEGLNVPDTIPELEENIHQHQTLIENITQAYTEVSFAGGIKRKNMFSAPFSFKNFLEDTSPFWGATDSHVLDFC